MMVSGSGGDGSRGADVDAAESANRAGNTCYREGRFEAACDCYTSALRAAAGGLREAQPSVAASAATSACRSKYYANR